MSEVTNSDIKGFGSAVRVDDAVGVSAAKWFIAIVNNRSEKANATRLSQLGIENYVPVQTVYRIWRNGRKAKVDQVVIPNVIFIHCTERERREVVKLPFIFRFMTDKAGSTQGSLSKPVAVVPDKEIRQLRFMLGQSDIPVTITERTYKTGDRVRIVRGSLAGLEGEVFELNNDKSELVVLLEHLGCARLQVDTASIEPVRKKT